MSHLIKRLESQFPAMIPIEVVRANFFPHLSEDTFNRRARANDLGFPIVRTDRSQKAAMFVYLEDLAEYLESRRTVAIHEHAAISRHA
ncbi:Pyocin activator protein PrtN [Paraburkholderia sp. JPY303]|uniref:pyocin activator PrtN family protein n=1 Tax=Paraburkholderia atlantica TaxID=2654982 RepID=UPI00159044ED|nr:pyocin activator PrtN family protein [Paraburkholderia atlantica]NUY33253.1 Pyocin activator protein PrtN [Paraburkholderia atlantica]